jgi:hypothetical protein
MSCHECGFCQADLPALENISVDARSRGNYKIATLLDAALEKCGVLQKNLQVNDREYLKNVSRMAKEQSSSDVCTTILRDAKRIVETSKGREQPTPHGGGFANMFAASRGVSSTPTPKHTEPKLRSSSGFIQMLEESGEGTYKEPIQRVFDEIEQDEAKYRRPTKRGMGFGNMLKASQTGTFEGDEEPQPEKRNRDLQPRLGFLRMLDTTYQQHVENGSVETRIPHGFVSMLESIWPKPTPKPVETLVKRSYIRGMGFANMLKGAAEGTE